MSDELREHATAILLKCAPEVERMTIREHLEDELGGDVDAADVEEIHRLIITASITVEWPAGDSQ